MILLEDEEIDVDDESFDCEGCGLKCLDYDSYAYHVNRCDEGIEGEDIN